MRESINTIVMSKVLDFPFDVLPHNVKERFVCIVCVQTFVFVFELTLIKQRSITHIQLCTVSVKLTEKCFLMFIQ